MAKRVHIPAKELRERVLKLIEESSDSKALLEELENFAPERHLRELTEVWGPLLYSKAPKIFRSFILRHFSTFSLGKNGWSYKPITWKGETGKRLQSWLDQVDSADDIELFKRLYIWKLNQQSYKKAAKAWQADLLKRFSEAKNARARQIVLQKLGLWYWLEEPSALSLYQTDADTSRAFILSNLPRDYSLFTGEKRVLWKELSQLAKANKDEDFYFELYRQQIPIKTWRQEAIRLCKELSCKEELVAELQKRHPQTFSEDLGSAFYDLLELRGEDIFAYVLPELRRVLRGWFRPSFGRLIELAEKRNWLVLWAGLLRTCGKEKEYGQAVRSCLRLERSAAVKRLGLLAGIGQEWNFAGFGIAQAPRLSDKVAIELHDRIPEILHGPMKVQLRTTWNDHYENFVPHLVKTDDQPLIDFMASRMITQSGSWGNEKILKMVALLASHYESLKVEPSRFAARAANVLGQVPPYVIWNYGELIKRNRLARLLYERSAKLYLDNPAALQDLLEAPEIHSQLLAYETLALDDDRAKRIAQKNLPILLGTLLRPIHRKTRVVALKALQNAANDEATASKICEQARMALDLPDLRYPKGELVSLIAQLLYRFPSLQTEGEQPLVYGAKPC